MPHRTSHFLFVDELSKASRKLRTLFDARVKQLGLTHARARVLMLLDRLEGLNQKELAEELEIETPTMVRLLDGLEGQGFIERRTVAGDRRAKQIHITATGSRLAKQVNELAEALRAEILRGIGEQELRQAVTVLKAVNRNIGTLGGRQ
ncbi:MAG: MarR family winged helix-turn-helix transcriptional regulator [Alphaproteobacteria bacterium]